jgi:hypothetical protein
VNRPSLFAIFAAACLSPVAGVLAQVEYSVVELTPPADTYSIFPTAMNNRGDIVGWWMSTAPGGLYSPWVCTAGGQVQVLPAVPGNGLRNKAMDINDSGQIVGDGYDNSGGAWIYSGGVYTLTPAWQGVTLGFARGMNNRGDWVGAYYTGIGSGNRGFVASPTPAVIDPSQDNQFIGINDAGHAVGAIGSTGGFTWDAQNGFEPIPAIDTTWTRMGTAKINNHGVVLGNSQPTGSVSAGIPYLYTRGGAPQTLPSLAAVTKGFGLNDLGHVVGEASGSGALFGWVYTPETGSRNLNTLIDPALGYQIRTATDINNSGQIVAHASISGSTLRRVLLLTPVGAPPPCYANCDGSVVAPVLNVLDFNCFLNRFSAGDPYANCDGSTVTPVLNVLDFNCFLNRFSAGCP